MRGMSSMTVVRPSGKRSSRRGAETLPMGSAEIRPTSILATAWMSWSRHRRTHEIGEVEV